MNSDREMEMYSDIGYMKGKMEGLEKFLHDHMEEEERKVTAIHRWLGVLSLIILLQFMGLTGPEIMEKLLGLF
jgi:hypothetical protein